MHQEIGYAMGVNIPVIPLAVGKFPGELIQQIHAIRVDPDKLSNLMTQLSLDRLEALIEQYSESGNAFNRCADFPEARSAMMVQHANDVLRLGVCALVRQKGGLSSFHIPTETLSHPAWQKRYGDRQRGMEHCRLQRRERMALTRHAKEAGCKLIINPTLQYVADGTMARVARLESLLHFLESMPDEKCFVAIKPKMDHPESITILGNWFCAESVSAQVGQGYFQTIFTRHAPTLRDKIEAFDQEFEDC
ncbi:MAG: hypothetical protein EHM23_10280 [Acidobacteria bacterium]|nr:MAG: hypothetical protein EHM23_10280 [Acidobacteriota bacterium]